jgi:hypothetical protein
MNKIINIVLLLSLLLSCKSEPNDNIQLQEHGVFVFLNDSDIDDKTELPDFVDPEAVLCFGKGLKVGRCISKQLEKDICIGLIKHNKRVIAIEITCGAMHQDSVIVISEPDAILTE